MAKVPQVSGDHARDIQLIDIDEEYIGQESTEKCIKKINQGRIDGKLAFELRAKAYVKEIDPLFLAYLILLKKQAERLTFKITFEEGIDGTRKETLRQIRAQLQMTTGDPLFELAGDREATISESLFVWSERYIPILFVDRNSFQKIFTEILPLTKIHPDTVDNSSKDRAYSGCRRELYKFYHPEKKNGLDLLKQLAFHNILYHANVQRPFLYHASTDFSGDIEKIVSAKTTKISGFTPPKGVSFYKAFKEYVLDQLIDQPAIHHYIYSTLLSAGLLPAGRWRDDIAKEVRDQLISLWAFAQELVDGLRELAKNIVEHSSNRRGAITGRVFTREKLAELEAGDKKRSELFEGYFKSLPDVKNLSFFDVNVIDDGDIGVVERLRLELAGSENEDEAKDITTIESDKLHFKHLLDPFEGPLLNQQAKRATAHLGLLIFSKLIEHNNGMVRAGTWLLGSNRSKRDPVLRLPISQYPWPNPENGKLPSIGTNYNIILPFDPQKPPKPYAPIKYKMPPETSAIELQGISDLLAYEIVDFRKGHQEQLHEGVRYIFIIAPASVKSISLRDEERRFWEESFSPLSDIHWRFVNGTSKDGERALIALDLKGITIDRSSFFRLIGRWELEHPGRPLIIFNIPRQYLEALADLNQRYIEREGADLPYWNSNSLAIIYSYDVLANGRFYFADALWGAERKDYLFINHQISKTNFNLTTMKIESSDSPDQDYLEMSTTPSEMLDRDTQAISRFGVFENGISLLPFDLLLNTSSGLSIFEENAMVLLNKELSSKRGMQDE